MAKEEPLSLIKNCIVDCMCLCDQSNVQGCVDRMVSAIRQLAIQNEVSITDDLCKFTVPTDTKQMELTLNGDQTSGIYFTFQGYKFHITKDSEYNSKFSSDLYHIWCECVSFDGEEMPMGHVYVNWLCGGDFLEGKHKAFLAAEITQQAFEKYLWNDVHIYCSNWLEKNKEKINK